MIRGQASRRCTALYLRNFSTLFGTTEEPAKTKIYHNTVFSAEVHEEKLALKRVAFAGRTIFEGISFILRDHAWGTTPLVTSNGFAAIARERASTLLDQEISADSIVLQGKGDAGDLQLEVLLALHAHACESVPACAVLPHIDFRVRARNRSITRAISTARVGFVALHALAPAAGRRLELVPADSCTAARGNINALHFPSAAKIDGQQPFTNVSSIRYGIDAPQHSGPRENDRDVEDYMHWVRCDFDGGEWHGTPQGFEMEDQRLWTDASFKTYVRPLSWPWPYNVEPGEILSQSVRLTFGVGTAHMSAISSASEDEDESHARASLPAPAHCVSHVLPSVTAHTLPVEIIPWDSTSGTGANADVIVAACKGLAEMTEDDELNRTVPQAQFKMPEIGLGLGVSAANTRDLLQASIGQRGAPLHHLASALKLPFIVCTLRCDEGEDPTDAMSALASATCLLGAVSLQLEVVLADPVSSDLVGALEQLCEVAAAARGAGLLGSEAKNTLTAVTIVWASELQTSAVDDIYVSGISASTDEAVARAQADREARELKRLRTLQTARDAFGPDVELGAGTLLGYAELCRWGQAVAPLSLEKQRSRRCFDFITHSTCAIVHDADDRAVMDTTYTLPHIAASVSAQFGSDVPYRVGPSSISMRFNPWGVATLRAPSFAHGGELAGIQHSTCRTPMVHDDPRQAGLFCAAFIVAYIAQVTGSCVSDEAARVPAHLALASVAPGDLFGPRGVFACDFTTDNAPDVQPAFHAIQAAASTAGKPLLQVKCPHGKIQAFATETNKQNDGLIGQAVIANVTNEPLQVSLNIATSQTVAHGGSLRATVLDENACVTGAWSPLALTRGADSNTVELSLGPYAVARLQSE